MSESDAFGQFEEKVERPDPSMPGGLGIFFATLAVLALVRVGLGYISFPTGALPFINVGLTAVFMGAPILALFYASNTQWKPINAVGLIAGGIVAHLGLFALDKLVVGGQGPVSGILGAVSQAGLTTWCIGLGALLTTLIKDKNLLIPISIFLIAYDAFLVLTPVGFTQVILKKLPAALPTVGMQIPAAIANTAAQPPGGKAEIGGYVGPADLVFIGMFFVALFRYGMKTRLTLTILIPTLVAYMGLVGITGIPLPAMVPIGLVLLIANWGEIRLSKQELGATIVLTLLCAGLLAYAATRPKPKQQVEILPEGSSQGAEAQGDSPVKVGPDPRQSAPQNAQGNTLSPQ